MAQTQIRNLGLKKTSKNLADGIFGMDTHALVL
jgi:hypothetical protein